jgi:hypothetical protein
MSTRLGKKHFDGMGKKELLLGKTFHFSKGTLFFLKRYSPREAFRQGRKTSGKKTVRGTENPSLVNERGAKVLKKGLVSSYHVVYGLGEFCVHFLCLILHEIQKFESLFFCVQLKYVLTFFLIEG